MSAIVLISRMLFVPSFFSSFAEGHTGGFSFRWFRRDGPFLFSERPDLNIRPPRHPKPFSSHLGFERRAEIGNNVELL